MHWDSREQGTDVPAVCFFGEEAEQGFGSRVEQLDTTLVVECDDRVRCRMNEHVGLRLALLQRTHQAVPVHGVV